MLISVFAHSSAVTGDCNAAYFGCVHPALHLFFCFVLFCSCSGIYYKQFRLSQEASVIFTTKSFVDKNHTVTP